MFFPRSTYFLNSLFFLKTSTLLLLSGFLCTLIEIHIETRKEMGLSLQNSSTNSKNPSTLTVNQCCDTNDNLSNLKPSLKKMFLDLGLSCFSPRGSRNDEKEHKSGNLEHNKAWLLAESGAELGTGDPHSVHSSFRFSFCSPNEVGSMAVNNNNAAATVLIVNLDNGLLEDDDDSCAQAQQLRWQRIESLEKSISPLTSTLIRFSFADILSATRNFRKGRVLGRGALSYVFRGRIGLLRTSVAIKRLDRADKESPKAFCRELMIASSLCHRNIVPLVGFCIDPEEGFFLVYKYVSGGSLESHLHDKKEGKKLRSPLSMSMRYKVAIGIGEAIAYLHNGIERCVVHRDIKPSNILLSSKKEPKLCDFGLATWTPAPSVPFLCKTVKGTFGYLAPEYFQHGKVSDKTDVYAFGVVLLELLTGRKPIEAKRPPGEENLVLWAKPLLQKGVRAMEELLDPRLKSNLRHSRQVARMMQAAAACTNTEESQRPGIYEIVAILKGEEDIFSSRKRSNFSGSGCVVDYYTQLQQTKSEVNNHLALALRGITELEDEDYFYYH